MKKFYILSQFQNSSKLSKRPRFALLTGITAAFLLFLNGCCSAEERELEKTILRNVEASARKDIETVLKDVDPPLREATREVLEDLFKKYDLSFRIERCRVKALAADTAQVEVVMVTKKVKGPAFRDNRSITLHTLKKRSDGWKLAGQEIKKISEL